MDKKLLPKNFFKENPLDQLSAPQIAYFAMTVGFDEKIQNMLQDVLDEALESGRKAQIKAEAAAISRLETGDETVKFMRSGYDIANREILCKKALTMQAEVMPPMLRRLRTSFQEKFVETAVYTLAHAEQVYIDQLIRIYPEIRSPYAQSMVCLVLGVQEREDTIELLLREYKRLKKDYPGESYCQGPLLAIYVLCGEM